MPCRAACVYKAGGRHGGRKWPRDIFFHFLRAVKEIEEEEALTMETRDDDDEDDDEQEEEEKERRVFYSL